MRIGSGSLADLQLLVVSDGECVVMVPERFERERFHFSPVIGDENYSVSDRTPAPVALRADTGKENGGTGLRVRGHKS